MYRSPAKVIVVLSG